MKTFCTNHFSIDATDGQIKKFEGIKIFANSWEEAEMICAKKFPYLQIEGELVCELDYHTLKEINLNLN